MKALAASIALVGLITISFGAGWRLGAFTADADAQSWHATSAATTAPGPLPLVEVGKVRFAERLGESLELESYRTQFARDGTIAWRAEFPEPPPTPELTVVIAWQSIRETMVLSRTTVSSPEEHPTIVGSDEVLVSDLVPTAGLYAVSYFAGERKLAEGVFEVLPPER